MQRTKKGLKNMINKTAINKRLKENGYTPTGIAATLGIARCTFAQKLSGYRTLKVTEVNKLMELLDIKPEEYNYFFNIQCI